LAGLRLQVAPTKKLPSGSFFFGCTNLMLTHLPDAKKARGLAPSRLSLISLFSRVEMLFS
jgi:hypothetical protein